MPKKIFAFIIIISSVLLSFFHFSVADDREGNIQDDKEKLYLSAATHFMRLCFVSDSQLYGQHRRALLNSDFPIIYDIPQFISHLPVTTTRLELFNVKGLFASLQLTNQKEQAKCSLVLEGLNYQDSELMEQIMERNYGIYLQNIGQDKTHKYWQYLQRNRDLSIISLYPANYENKSKTLELARNFEILPIRSDAPFHETDLQTYMRSEDHLVALSLHLFVAAPYWNHWINLMERMPLITKAETKKTDNLKLYLISRQPQFEVQLMKGNVTHTASMILNRYDYDMKKMKEIYTQRLPLFFEKIEEVPTEEGKYATWHGFRDNISFVISMQKQIDHPLFSITFSIQPLGTYEQ